MLAMGDIFWIQITNRLSENDGKNIQTVAIRELEWLC